MWLLLSSKKSEERNDPLCSDISKLLREFRENLTDDRVPEHRDSHVSSSHESSLESTRSVDLGKHSNYTHLSKDRNYEICKRTKITRVPCRRRNSGVVSRTKIFDDLITVFFFSWEALIKTTQLARNICWLCNLKTMSCKDGWQVMIVRNNVEDWGWRKSEYSRELIQSWKFRLRSWIYSQSYSWYVQSFMLSYYVTSS